MRESDALGTGTVGRESRQLVTPDPAISGSAHGNETTFGERIRKAFSLRENVTRLIVRPRSNLPELDGIRALSICWVVVFHAAWYAAPLIPLPLYASMVSSPWMLPVWRGDFGVDVFFVLSGFLIAGMLIDEHAKTGRIYLERFYWRRLLRLWPALIVAVIIEVVIIDDHTSMVWANLLYINNFFPILDASMGWTWSLSIEEQFYLICPWLIGAFGLVGVRARVGLSLALLGALGACAALVVTSRGFHAIDSEIVVNRDFLTWAAGYDHLYVKPWMRAGPLVVGVVSAYLYREPRVMRCLSKGTLLGVLGTGVALSVAAISTHWPLLLGKPRVLEVLYLATYRTFFGVAVAYLMLLSLSEHPIGRISKRFLSLRIFYPIAQLAYAAYLVNPIVTSQIEKHMAPWVWQGKGSPMLLFLPVTAIMTFALATMIHLGVERPIMRLRP